MKVMMNPEYHKPVLLDESVNGLITDRSGNYVDATFGGGGHSSVLLERLNADGRLLAFDKDPSAKQNAPVDPRFILAEHDFIYLRQFLKYYNMMPADGIMADLGVSSYQFDTPEKGFSYRHNARLDMRMDPETKLTAEHVINDYPEKELKQIFRTYGEIKNASNLAREIVARRKKDRITTTGALSEIVEKAGPSGPKKSKYLSMVFQALRIEVNRELEHLKVFIKESVDCLKPGGRLVIISYHSLEDRLVKHFFASGNFEGKQEKDFYGSVLRPLEPVTRKAIKPDEKEITENVRARSARLRIAEKNQES